MGHRFSQEQWVTPRIGEGETPPQSIHRENLFSFFAWASCVWNWKRLDFSLSFCLLLLLPPPFLAFLERYSHITQTWFGSDLPSPDSIQFQYLWSICWIQSSHFFVTTQVGENCWEPGTWNMDPEARGRDLGITRFWTRMSVTGFPTQVPSDGRKARERPIRPTFP